MGDDVSTFFGRHPKQMNLPHSQRSPLLSHPQVEQTSTVSSATAYTSFLVYTTILEQVKSTSLDSMPSFPRIEA